MGNCSRNWIIADSSSSEKVFQIRPEEALDCCTMLLSSLHKSSESYVVIEGRSLTWSGANSGTGSINQKRRNTTSPQNNPRNPKPISNRLRKVPNSISYQASNRPIRYWRKPVGDGEEGEVRVFGFGGGVEGLETVLNGGCRLEAFRFVLVPPSELVS
ncbi:hypothetical protein RHGRI_027568 [Rhododendron griersonianum]|uniref:Uncharacterized protein n=1 Tax=Rhododendron griersonianum TaxID=479676 RepID=A0AAV6IXB6_9ERIC|nr:hypothetical protein RHGRI_027568 [Rhododendron griersonianum]